MAGPSVTDDNSQVDRAIVLGMACGIPYQQLRETPWRYARAFLAFVEQGGI